MSSSPSSSPSPRSPLTLLSKLKRQLSKSPVAQPRKQPVEHQYLPIPTVSFSESNPALSTYSCSNNSSASFVFIEEEPGTCGADDFRPFLPLIIQHERLQQRLAAASTPPRVATRGQRTRIPPNEPPSPTSTASSKSPVTPVFPASFFDEEEDDIMTLSSSDVGSISEYSLPRSLSAYMQEARSGRRGRKSGYQTSSDSESRHGRLSVRTPPRPKKSFPPISPPPSCPLPEPPKPAVRRVRSISTNLGLPSDSTAPSSPPSITLPVSPDTTTKTKKAKPRPQSILSDLEIFDSAAAFAFTATASCYDQLQVPNEYDDPDDIFTALTSPSTPTTPTPRQYGMGRQVIRGSGTGRDFGPDFGDFKTGKRDSTATERKESGPESTLDSKAEEGKPDVQVDQDHTPSTSTSTQTQSPPPPQRRRVKSDDTNPTVDPSVTRRTTHREKARKRIHPEWTLFLGIPRNAAPPPPSPSVLFSTGLPMSSTGEPNVNHIAVSKLDSTFFSITTDAPAMKDKSRHSFLPTYFPPTMSIRNRTKSDSALLASASASASGDANNKTKTKLGEEDWTLSLPLVVSPSTSSAKVPRGSKTASGSGSVQAEVGEERVGGEGLVITVEDVDDGKERRRVQVDHPEVESREENQESLILRVPRIVRSCSSAPLLSCSAAFPTHTNNARVKKSSTKWMEMEATTTAPTLRGVSLEEEVLLMLLGDGAADDGSNTRSRSSSSSSTKTDLTSATDLAQKKMATLDEDLARFNALLRNGSLSRSKSRPASMVIETALAAAATMTKTKTVTLNSHPDPIPSPTTTTSTSPLLKKKSRSSQTLPVLKPVLKHAKSCEPFLESSVHPFPLPTSSMSPVMRSPSSTGKGDLNFFDELGGDTGGRRLKPSSASLRLTRSAEWSSMGELGDTVAPPISTMSMSTSTRASPPPQRQHRTTRSISPPMTSTQTLLLPFASSSALKSKRSLRFKMDGMRGCVPSMPFRAASMGSLSCTSVPVEPNLGFRNCHTEKPQPQHRKRSPPTHLRLHSSSPSSSSSSASSSTNTASSQRHISFKINNRRRSISPPPPPSPVQSESSSALPTPLASAFPLPPSSPRISMSGLQQKLRAFENARGQQQQQQQEEQQPKREGDQYLQYKPPSTASSVCSLVSSASSTATVVPSGDQKTRMRMRAVGGGVGPVQEGGEGMRGRETGDVPEEDEDSMCSSTYYSARSSFSQMV